MTTSHSSPPVTKAGGFGYRIRPAATGWAWSVYDHAGQVTASGLAPTRAIAAAYIVERQAAKALAPGALTRHAAA